MSPLPGVPDRRPVFVSKSAHWGRFSIEKVSTSPSASEAVGTKLYADPATTCVCGLPEIVGAWFSLPLGGWLPPDWLACASPPSSPPHAASASADKARTPYAHMRPCADQRFRPVSSFEWGFRMYG